MFRRLSILLLAFLSVAAQADVWHARYGVGETFNFRLYNADGTLDVDEADGGTEVSLSCNEGAETTATNDFVDEGTFYSIALTATELQCERIAVVIAATTTEVFFIQTHSNASAMTPASDANLVNIAGSAVSTSTAQLGVNVVNAGGTAWGSGAITAGSIATDAITAAKIATDAIGAAEIAADAIGASEIATGAIDTTALASGSITAAAIATDAIGAAEVAADVSTEFLTGLANLAVNVAQISGDSGAADALETAFDGTAGAVSPLGIARQGTAQSATGTTLVLDSSASFADDTAIGMTLVACGSTQGYCQSRSVTDYVSSTDTATVDTWTVTPSGTVTYYLFSTAPSSGGGGLDAAGIRSAIGLASANLDTQLSTIDTNVDAILVDTSTTLDDMVDDLETRLTSTRAGYLDNLSAGAVATASALATVDTVVDSILLDTGTDGVVVASGSKTGYALSATGIDAIWDEAQSGHVTAGTFGAYLDAPVSSGSGGGLDAAGVRAAIGLATANLDTQLADIPTVSEFNARTVTSATYATATALQTVDDNVDAILVDTGTTLQAELDGIQADTEDLQTQIGVAGAGLTAADDAVITAIAALNNLSATDVGNITIEDQGGGVSLRCALAVMLSYAAGDLTTSSNAPTYEDPSGTETRISGTISSAGNRTMTITCPTY